MENKIIDNLTNKSVSIRTVFPNGQIHRKAYDNSITGRTEIQNELSEEFQNAILAVWGESAIVDEDVF